MSRLPPIDEQTPFDEWERREADLKHAMRKRDTMLSVVTGLLLGTGAYAVILALAGATPVLVLCTLDLISK